MQLENTRALMKTEGKEVKYIVTNISNETQWDTKTPWDIGYENPTFPWLEKPQSLSHEAKDKEGLRRASTSSSCHCIKHLYYTSVHDRKLFDKQLQIPAWQWGTTNYVYEKTEKTHQYVSFGQTKTMSWGAVWTIGTVTHMFSDPSKKKRHSRWCA